MVIMIIITIIIVTIIINYKDFCSVISYSSWRFKTLFGDF